MITVFPSVMSVIILPFLCSLYCLRYWKYHSGLVDHYLDLRKGFLLLFFFSSLVEIQSHFQSCLHE